uniref:Uncharacterized protein n=1 Tax=Myripristis murdjan TaxID=586833 RepID=A0A667YPQ0_9TELE
VGTACPGLSVLLLIARNIVLSVPHRWLVCTLTVKIFQNALNAELKIRSVGLFSVRGISIQFHPQHTVQLCLILWALLFHLWSL